MCLMRVGSGPQDPHRADPAGGWRLPARDGHRFQDTTSGNGRLGSLLIQQSRHYGNPEANPDSRSRGQWGDRSE